MPNIKIGCAGFSYDDWIGSFYPEYISKDRYLSYYSKYFNIVETNSTHYAIPKVSTLKKWVTAVPEKFKFSVKIWNQVTHIKDYGLGAQHLESFLSALNPLSEKIAYYLMQFPPSFKHTDDHRKYIKDLLAQFDPSIKVAVELRDNSWFDPEILRQLLNGTNHILGTVYLDKITPYYPEWQKNFYIRVIGDKSLTKFDRVQREITEIWSHLMNSMNKYKERTDIDDIFVIFNNHYSGFSPTDSNRLKNELNLPINDFSKRKSITDYF